MNIKLITFKTNHTVLAEVVDEGNLGLKIKQPVQVVMQPTKDGPVMAFGPFLDYCEEFKTGITISNEDVLTINTPIRELENQYNQVFGSGITIASSIPGV